ncbi:MAG: tetratricopeptide repeat protein [Saprospiraceae bacterium]
MRFPENKYLPSVALISLAILLYINTLHHSFVLDDEVVITGNTYVQKGLDGIPSIFSHDSFAGYLRVGEGEKLLPGGRYRPLSLALFAALYSIAGANSLPFHFMAILLYACCGLMFWKFLLLLLKNMASGEMIAFFSAVLFIVHPVHTEVVANVKSCDEQLSLLLGLGALYSLLRSLESKRFKWILLTVILFLAACLSKENVITFVIIGPLSIWYYRKIKFSSALRSLIPMFLGAALFLLFRTMALGMEASRNMIPEPLNNPFLQWNGHEWINCSLWTKWATIIYTFGQDARLMFFPFPLTHDYYPFQIELKNFADPFVLLSLLILIILIVFGILSIRRRQIAGFGVLFFLIAISITSNILIPVGTFMAERFLFLPSVGFCLAITMGVIQLLGTNRVKIGLPLFGCVAIIFGMMTILRNPAWKDNKTLFQTDLKYSSNSIKLRNDLGTLLLTEALKATDQKVRISLLSEALIHLKAAIQFHPTYYDAHLAYGACTYYLGQYKESVEAYRRAVQLFPDDIKSKTGLNYALVAYGNYLVTKNDIEAGVSVLQEAWNIKTDVSIATNLANYYHGLGNSAKEIEWYEKAILLAPGDAQLNFKLAKAYRGSGNNTAAEKAFMKAKELDPGIGEL